MKRIAALVLVTLLTALVPMMASAGQGPSDEVRATSAFLQGDLGYLSTSRAVVSTDEIGDAARHFLQGLVLERFAAVGDEEMVVSRVKTDDLGLVHVRFDEHINGLPVVGAQLIVHADKSGKVYAVNGEFARSEGVAFAPAIDGQAAIETALELSDIRGRIRTEPELTYVLSAKGEAVLAYKSLVAYHDEEGIQRDVVFADAVTGALVARHPTIHRAKSWRTYTANNGTSLPGTSLCINTASCGDSVAQTAHNNASDTYDYYNVKFGRDSLNGAGLQLKSTVHYSSNYNNAFWNSSQMVYGDGDGSVFSPLGNALDVVAHELTHGVTEYESGLIYSNESGALNEALSDIFGAAAESWKDGSVNSNTWKLGEDIYTPGTSGDALRYMNNPTADGSSRDYYPERYTGSSDNGGVHWNSGIANLAFYLLVQGGSHPRGKTSTVVTGIGMTKAEQIFYRAQTNYLSASSNFQAARNATAQAATDLYGATETSAVHAAWDAVGAPGGGGGGGGGGTLQNGVPVSGLSGGTGSLTYFTLSVPSGASNLSFQMSGGSGDADLYVRFGSQPTTSTYNCRPYLNGNNETCNFASPSAGTWHVMIRGYSAYSGVTLVASFTGGGGGCTPGGGSLSGLSGSTGSQANYTETVPSCATTFTVSISGGSGDADLYVRYGSAPTTSTYNCRPYLNGNNETCTFSAPSSGTWYIMIRAYSTYSGVTLTTSYQ